jgi:small neutral amino acid transporter SnatA (MarC family)
MVPTEFMRVSLVALAVSMLADGIDGIDLDQAG